MRHNPPVEISRLALDHDNESTMRNSQMLVGKVGESKFMMRIFVEIRGH